MANSATNNVDKEAAARASLLDGAPSTGVLDPSLLLLPYVEFSRVMMRAHKNACAMMEANRALMDGLRDVMRRQQDVALEIAEAAIQFEREQAEGVPDQQLLTDRDGVFMRAADAVREIGEAVIDAQLAAMQTLRDRSADNMNLLSPEKFEGARAH